MAEARIRDEEAAGVSAGDHARIAASGLFDAEFYLATYGPLAADEDPLRHFLSVGLDQGRRPSAQFDPALYRLVYPECGDANPLLHHLDCGTALPDLAEHLADLVTAFRNAWPAAREKKSRFSKAEADLQLEHAGEVARRYSFEVEISGATYTITSPAPQEILNRLASGDPFAFARLPNGYWAALSRRNKIAKAPAFSRLKPAERLALAARVSALLRPQNGTFADAFFDEVSAIARAHAGDPQFLRAVGFKGFPTPDEGLFRPEASQRMIAGRLTLFSRYFEPDDKIYDATMWKRFAFSGDLDKLPEACRDSHVVFLGPDYLADLGSRWANPFYTSIPIGRRCTHYERYALLAHAKQTLAAIADDSSRPVVLFTQCGGSLAFWLINHLYAWRKDMTYIDLGQSVNIWFGDREDLPRYRWFQVYSAMAERR